MSEGSDGGVTGPWREKLRQWREAVVCRCEEPCWCTCSGIPRSAGERSGVNVFAGVEYCSCEEGQTWLSRARQEAQEGAAEVVETYRQWLWRESGVPRLYWELTLRTHPKATARRLLCPADVSKREAWRESSWFIWGPVGTGKTGVAAGFLREHIWHSGLALTSSRPLFRTVPDLLAEIRATYGDQATKAESDVMAQYRAARLLVLDDLGAEQVKGTGWAADRLYQVVGYRHANQLATVYTSNLGTEALETRLGERIVDRIVEQCGSNVIELRGANLRRQRKQEG